MGLLLSILVFSVGVLEALACVRRIQQGILPAWAPRHVTTSSGRRLLRERWRKSTSLDDGSGEALGAAGEAPVANGVSRRRLAERQGSQDEERGGRPRPPPPPPLTLTLTNESPLHHVRSPDIHWPEHVPHSPVKCVEQSLPSPVLEVPADVPTWPGEASQKPQSASSSYAPVEPEAALLQRRRTSTTETLPQEEQGPAQPLRDATPDASFAREAREPRRLKPAKASSFEEARIEHFAQPEVKAPEVISLSYSDLSSAGPRTAVVGRIEIKATRSDSQDGPAPWPIVNIDTVVTPDEQGDLTPPSDSGLRRVSFDPVPTVVLIDNERSVAEEKKFGAVLAPSIRITDDLEGVLRKELPKVIDDIIQEALLRATDILDLRRNGQLNGVSLILENIVAKGPLSNLQNGHLSNRNVEEYNDRFQPKIETVVEQTRKDKLPTTPKIQVPESIGHSNNTSSANSLPGEEEILMEGQYQSGRTQMECAAEVPQEAEQSVFSRIEVSDATNITASPTSQVTPKIPSMVSAQNEKEVLESSAPKKSQPSESEVEKAQGRFPQKSSAEVGDEERFLTSEDSARENSLPQSEPNFIATTDLNEIIPQQTLPEDFPRIATDVSKSPHETTKQTNKTTERADENETRYENQQRNEATKDDTVEECAGNLGTAAAPTVVAASAEGEDDVTVAVAAGAPERKKPSTASFITEVTAVSPPDASVPFPAHSVPEPRVSASPDIPGGASESRNIPSVISGPSETTSTPPVVPTAPVSQDSRTDSTILTSHIVSDTPTPSVPVSTVLAEQTAPTSPAVTAISNATPPTSGVTHKTSPTPIVPKVEASSSEPASRSPGGMRFVAPATAVQQPEAFWVSDASVPPQSPSAPPLKDATTTFKCPSPTTFAAQLRSSFESAKAAFTPPSSQTSPSPVIPKPSFAPKATGSPVVAPKKFAPVAPTIPSFSPFGAKVITPSFIKPTNAPKSSAFVIPEVTSGSQGPSTFPSSPSLVSPRSFESVPTVPTPIPDPAPSPSESEETVSESLTAFNVAPSPASSPGSDTALPDSPSLPPLPSLSRNPQEVVRRIAELRRNNPAVASEVLLSILGFKFS